LRLDSFLPQPLTHFHEARLCGMHMPPLRCVRIQQVASASALLFHLTQRIVRHARSYGIAGPPTSPLDRQCAGFLERSSRCDDGQSWTQEFTMFRRTFLRSCLHSIAALLVRRDLAAPVPAPLSSSRPLTRSGWLRLPSRSSRRSSKPPPIGACSSSCPSKAAPGHVADRRPVTCLKAVARTLAGLAPWLERGPSDGDEGRLRSRLTELAG
jgi:hypothetical protein